MTVFFRQFSEATDEDAHLTREQFLHHLSFSPLKDVSVVGGRAGKVRVSLLELVKTFAIDKDAIDEIQEVITRRSMCSPIGRYVLLRTEDLFDHDIASRETVEIFLRIQQTVHMINAQTGDLSLR